MGEINLSLLFPQCSPAEPTIPEWVVSEIQGFACQRALEKEERGALPLPLLCLTARADQWSTLPTKPADQLSTQNQSQVKTMCV